ncbi:hypothetical protein PIROE2DRAFT_8878 [Piromyces sp. E2]|nr:hypothetical protein PIROE2DRAFT_8878 [Piromyces sp. E2]|eukprot:OUM64327.1 hypothetical protein PIROE2DRAFT_8878 [Piromyces sp. E2]
MTKIASHNLEFTIEKNISFIGDEKKKTVLDYKRDIKSSMHFLFNNKGNTIKIENFILKNYNPEGQNNTHAFVIFSESDNYQVIFNNCIFQNNDYELINLNVFCNKQTQYIPQLLFTNCNFYDNSKSIVSTRHRNSLSNDDLYKCLTIKLVNCNLIRNNALFFSHIAGFIFENCNNIKN